MAKLRKWAAYRKIERPYTRWSKVRSKAFVKSRPGKKIIKYDMGNVISGPRQFGIVIRMSSKDAAQIRTNALEAARITTLKKLETKFGRFGFYFKIRVVPHQVIRENPLAAGAGADRVSTGMKHSFGKTIGTAARVEPGQILFEIFLSREQESFGREVLSIASKKLPVKVAITSELQEVVKLSEEEIEKVKAETKKGREAEEAKKKAQEEAENTKKESDKKNESHEAKKK